MLEKLTQPPIMEVVCGFLFEPIQELDPLLVGVYWWDRRQDFPTKQLQPALTSPPSITLGRLVGPLRSWLVNNDQSLLVQIQADRFYLNWRKQNGPYPRFSDHGEDPGVLAIALKEFAQFGDFCKQHLGKQITVREIELAKIDHLVQKVHWDNFEDLAKALPWLEVLAAYSKAETPSVRLRFQEQRGDAQVSIALDTAQRKSEQGLEDILKIESQITKTVKGDCKDEFLWANQELNASFELMIPKDQRDKRFNKEPAA